MISFLGILLLTLPALLVLYLYYTYTYWSRRGVVYETPIPLLGNFKGVGSSLHNRDIIQRLYDKFKGKGPFGGTYMFVSKAALILDLDLVKHIMVKDFSNFHDRGMFSNVKDDPLTGHLVNLEGEQWRAMRSKLSAVFTSARMKFICSTVVEVGENFAKVMSEEIMKTKDQIVEMNDLCDRFTTDVIGTCVFGIECNSLKDPNAEFRRKGRSIFTDHRHSPLVKTFMITNPGLARKLRMKLLTDHLNDFFLNLVKGTVEYRLKNNVKRNDFMDLLIQMKAENEELAKDSANIDLSQGISIEQMSAQTFVFFVAGYETSSTTMSFCLYELAKNLEVQETLRTEILHALNECEGKITYECLNSMTYLEQVLSETLRLYPILPNLIRKTKKDYQVPNSTHVIEQGTTVIIPVSSIHYDPEYYDNPSEFQPARFEATETENRHSSAYLPFGDGPRNCIGSRFGKMQTKIGLISLLKNYRFECCPLTEIPIEIDKKNIMILAKNGIHLKVIDLTK